MAILHTRLQPPRGWFCLHRVFPGFASLSPSRTCMSSRDQSCLLLTFPPEEDEAWRKGDEERREVGRISVAPSSHLGCRAGHASSATTALPFPGLRAGWRNVHPAARLAPGALMSGLQSQTDAGEWCPLPQAIREMQHCTSTHGLQKCLGMLTTCLVACKNPRHTPVMTQLTLPYALWSSGSAPQPALPNAGHCCMCSSCCVGVEVVQVSVCFRCCQVLTNRDENASR